MERRTPAVAVVAVVALLSACDAEQTKVVRTATKQLGSPVVKRPLTTRTAVTYSPSGSSVTLDPRSDDQLARMTQVTLQAGVLAYDKYAVTDDGKLALGSSEQIRIADFGDAMLVRRGDGVEARITRQGRHLGGHGASSEDTLRLLLPEQQLSVGAVYPQRDLPAPYTTAEVNALDVVQSTATKQLIERGVVLGLVSSTPIAKSAVAVVRPVAPGPIAPPVEAPKILLLQGTVRPYVMPTRRARADAARFAAMAISDFSPGWKSKPTGVTYRYYLLARDARGAVRATLIAEASAWYGAVDGDLPRYVRGSVFYDDKLSALAWAARETDAVGLVFLLDPERSDLSPSLRSAVRGALAALPADRTALFADNLRRPAPPCLHCASPVALPLPWIVR